jgi:predicted secreted protein
MPPRIEITPEAAAAAREPYERTLTPVSEICARMGVSRSVLYARAREWKRALRRYSSGDEGMQAVAQEVGAADIAAAMEEATPDERRASLRLHMLRLAEIEMTVIERGLRLLNPKTEAQSERVARIVASFNRSFHEIAAIAIPDDVPADDPAQEQFPRDIDELRSELARRIHALVDPRRASGVAGDRAGDGRVD